MVLKSLSEQVLRYRQLAALGALFARYGLAWRAGRALAPDVSAHDHRVCRTLAPRVLSWLGVRVTIRGLDHVAGLERFCVVCNHASYLDWAVLLGFFPAPLRFIAKRELTTMPVVGHFLRHRGVLIDRSRREESKAAIRRAVEDQDDWPILIFPEGTRSHDGAIAPFKRGGLRILAEAGLSLLPVCVLGSYQAYSRHARFVQPNAHLTMCVGEPVHPQRCASIEHAIDLVEQRIRTMCKSGEIENSVTPIGDRSSCL